MMNRPTPKQTAPEIKVPLLNGEEWDLSLQSPKSFTLLVFYRGLHCPICRKYLQQLESLKPELDQLGVDIVAISMDSEKRARLSRQKWGINELKLAYGLPQETAENWGLYFSKGVREGEPELFSEPGLFLIDNKNKVYYSAINSNPWGRPYLPSFVKAIDYILSANYPARGEYLNN